MQINDVYVLQLELVKLGKLQTPGKVAYAVIKNGKMLEKILQSTQEQADAIMAKYLTPSEEKDPAKRWKMNGEKLYFPSPEQEKDYVDAMAELEKQEHDVTFHKVKESDLGSFSVVPSEYINFFTHIVE